MQFQNAQNDEETSLLPTQHVAVAPKSQSFVKTLGLVLLFAFVAVVSYTSGQKYGSAGSAALNLKAQPSQKSSMLAFKTSGTTSNFATSMQKIAKVKAPKAPKAPKTKKEKAPKAPKNNAPQQNSCQYFDTAGCCTSDPTGAYCKNENLEATACYPSDIPCADFSADHQNDNQDGDGPPVCVEGQVMTTCYPLVAANGGTMNYASCECVANLDKSTCDGDELEKIWDFVKHGDDGVCTSYGIVGNANDNGPPTCIASQFGHCEALFKTGPESSGCECLASLNTSTCTATNLLYMNDYFTNYCGLFNDAPVGGPVAGPATAY